MKPIVLAAAIGMAGATVLSHAQDCASAVTLAGSSSYVSDTTGTTDWMSQFGPLSSGGSNDMLYTFIAGPQPIGQIRVDASNYTFAMYLIPSCSDTGSEPTPIRATATVGGVIELSSGSPPITSGAQYWLAVTGAAATPANGTVNFSVTLPVSLQSFWVE